MRRMSTMATAKPRMEVWGINSIPWVDGYRCRVTDDLVYPYTEGTEKEKEWLEGHEQATYDLKVGDRNREVKKKAEAAYKKPTRRTA